MEDNPYSDLPFGLLEKIESEQSLKTNFRLDNPYCDLSYSFSISILWRESGNPYGFGSALTDEEAFASAMLELEYGFPELVRLYRLYSHHLPPIKK